MTRTLTSNGTSPKQKDSGSADGNGRRPPTGFGRMLKELREAKGMSQAVLARAAGVSPGYVGLIETGERGERPALEKVRSFSQALQASMEETEALLRVSGHLGLNETLIAKENPTFEEFVGNDKLLSDTQRSILISMYRSWVRA